MFHRQNSLFESGSAVAERSNASPESKSSKHGAETLSVVTAPLLCLTQSAATSDPEAYKSKTIELDKPDFEEAEAVMWGDKPARYQLFMARYLHTQE